MKKLVLSLFVLTTMASVAEPTADQAYRFFPQSQPAQKELLKLIQSEKFSQSLIFWSSSLAGEKFKDSATGRALYNYLVFKSGAPVSALERLFSEPRPQDIHGTVVSLIKKELSNSPRFAHLAKVRPSKSWRKVLGSSLAKELARPGFINLNKRSTIQELSRLLKKKSEPAALQAKRRFQLGLAASVQNQNQLAYNQFVRLVESDQTTVPKADLYMALARLSYQQGEYDAAVDWYKQVPKGSPLWLESKEEQAWSYLRLDQPNEAVAQLESATSPVFSSVAGPESDFLNSFVSLMICDYQKIFKITGSFKKKHEARIKGLESLSQDPEASLTQQFVGLVDSKRLKLASFSKLVKSLPRDFFLDEFLQRHMEYRKAMSNEAAILTKLNKGKLQLETFESQSQANSITGISSKARKSAEEAAKEIGLRLAYLAKQELAEFKIMISKLHLVEAEVIQRLHLDENINGKRSKLENPVASSSDVMTFPVTQEVWLDELDSYHAEVKDCPKLERASL